MNIKPEDLENKKVIKITNLQLKKIKEIMLNGILLAVDLDGKTILLTTDKSVSSGLKIKSKII
ncbi:MAG: hypothetical protein ACTSRG_18745 [Candidatus Helarchaeota archaeon]